MAPQRPVLSKAWTPDSSQQTTAPWAQPAASFVPSACRLGISLWAVVFLLQTRRSTYAPVHLPNVVAGGGTETRIVPARDRRRVAAAEQVDAAVVQSQGQFRPERVEAALPHPALLVGERKRARKK